MRSSARPATAFVVAAALGIAGCAPALDWREFDPEGTGLHVGFPCRPDRVARPLPLGAHTATMTMLACEAAGQTFSVGFVDLAPGDDADQVMRAWRVAAAGRLGAPDAAPRPRPVPGTTPHRDAGAVALDGHLPDGRPVRAQFLWFAREGRVYQAGTVGTATNPEATETFFAALRLAE